MKAFTMQSNNKIGAWAHMRPPLFSFCNLRKIYIIHGRVFVMVVFAHLQKAGLSQI